MKLAVVLSAVASLQLAAASPDPQITPLAQLHPRQDTPSDPALVGWVSTSGASSFADRRTCDSPHTLSVSGSLAQCCPPDEGCPFFSTCSGGTLLASGTSVFCDNGYCNTGVIVSTTGASDGQSFLGCWPTSLGQDPFSLVLDIGSAPIATPTGDSSSGASGSGTESSGGSSSTSESSSSGSSSASGTATGQATSKSTGAAGMMGAEPLTGVLGFVAGLLALL